MSLIITYTSPDCSLLQGGEGGESLRDEDITQEELEARLNNTSEDIWSQIFFCHMHFKKVAATASDAIAALQTAEAALGSFGGDNRAGIEGAPSE